ncbi:MAG: 30S ribosome-binding factor RbfA [Candidatus Zixiibacteriota bacterium]
MKSYPRAKRVADNIRKQMSVLLDEELDGEACGMVSVTDVELTRDLRQAKVYFSTLGNETERGVALEYLKENTKRLRGKLARRIALKFVPELSFIYDSSMADGMRIEKIFNQLENERRSASGANASSPGE